MLILTFLVTISQQPASPPLLDPIPTSSSLLSPENPNHYELSDSPEPIPSKDLPLINDPIPPADKELQAPLDVHPSPLPNSTLNPTLPKSVTPTSVPGKPSSRKTSWFSSLATSKGKQKTILSDVKTSEATSALSNPIANVVVSQPEGSAIGSLFHSSPDYFLNNNDCMLIYTRFDEVKCETREFTYYLKL